jgi:D-beta-D-heptose 7-phosphate kinase/D-beta-D-heptose 1-phosphate adenosyltransferase
MGQKDLIKSVQEAIRQAELYQRKGKKIVLCHGCFDILHDGHLKLFRKAGKVGNAVFVWVESDEYVRKNKGEGRPRYFLKERAKNVLETGLVDFVFSAPYNDDMSIYKQIYKQIRPNFLVTGDDEILELKKRDVEEIGIKIMVLKKNISSNDYFLPKA